MNKPAKPKISESETKAAVQLAKENGGIIDSLDKLVCQYHSKAIFSADPIYGSGCGSMFYNWAHRKKVVDTISNQYSCDSCLAENLPWNQRTVAYDCPECGIVTGHYHQEGYSYGNGAALSSGKGVNYLCRICNTKIGESPGSIRS